MIKVVGEDTSVIKKVTCRNCAALLEYTPSETLSRYGTDYSGGPDGEIWINCPRCGKKVILRSW